MNFGSRNYSKKTFSVKCSGRQRVGLTAQRGVSMAELLVAAALGVFLLFGLVSFVGVSNLNFVATGHSARIQETGRIALDNLSEDIRRAGFWAGVVYENDLSEVVQGTLPVTPIGSDCGVLGSNGGYATQIDLNIFGLNDENDGYGCIVPDRYLRGDIVTVRYASGEPIDSQTTLADDVPYIKLGAQEARLFLGADVDQSINQGNDVRASIHALNAVTYFVGDSGRSCKGEAIPSLFRTVFSADTAQPEVEEVLPGVEHVQLQYLVSNADDTIQYQNADDVEDWRTIVGVKLWVLARAECPEDYIERIQGEPGDLDFGDVRYAQPAGFRRALFEQVISRRNM